jgi:hypothetical protein
MNAAETNSPRQRSTAGFAAWLLLASAGNVFSATYYVDQNSPNPTPPYTDWATAATNIQDAVDAAAAGDEVVVTNGTYASGAWGGGQSNRVALLKTLTVRSVNGPAVTVIDGAGSVRCVRLTAGSSISGFTLTNGYVHGGFGGDGLGGGGVFCGGPTAVVSNCVIVGNSVHGYDNEMYTGSGQGGGAYGGTLNNCALIGNSAHGDIYFGLEIVFAAGQGGGAANCSLNNCVLIGNSAYAAPGDPMDAPGEGGGAVYCSLNNCLLVGNYADDCGGGVSGSAVNNCVVYFNTAPAEENFDSYSILNYCCTTPMPGYDGLGNITNAPIFVDLNSGNLRLQSNSPCINAGNNSYAPAGSDLDGNPRISGGTVDIGAYEFQNPAAIISYAWLQRYGLPTDGSADHSDSDGDGMDNWREWLCGTDPTNPLSVLRMVSALPTGTNATVTWQSVAGVNYFVERSTNLAVPGTLTPIATNIPGQAGTTTYTDTNAVGPGPFFYRVGVGN